MQTMVDLECPQCKKFFQRVLGAFNRSLKKNRQICCSKKCSAKSSVDKKLGKYYFSVNKEQLDKYGRNGSRGINKCDKYSPFRRFLKSKKHSVEISLDYLLNLWEKQNGICPFTGWKLKLQQSTCKNHQLELTPDRASIDRIDSSKGYVEGNVQFVSYMYNVCKNKFSDEQVKFFIESCHKNHDK